MCEVRTQDYKGFKMREVRNGHGEIDVALVETPFGAVDVVDFDEGRTFIDAMNRRQIETRRLAG